MSGKDTRYSAAAKICSFIRLLLANFSVHRKSVSDMLHKNLSGDNFRDKAHLSLFTILGMGLFPTEHTGICYDKSYMKRNYQQLRVLEFKKVFPSARIPPNPDSFLNFQAFLYCSFDERSPLSFYDCLVFNSFTSFVSVITQNAENAPMLIKDGPEYFGKVAKTKLFARMHIFRLLASCR